MNDEKSELQVFLEVETMKKSIQDLRRELRRVKKQLRELHDDVELDELEED